MQLRPPRFIKHFLQGLLMGGADVIPGVSGGTIALIVGIYEGLIDSISSGFSAVISGLRLDWEGARAHLSEVDWRLVIPLGLGIVTAVVLGATVILSLIERFPHESQALFFGLVAASILVPWQRIASPGKREVAIAAVAAVVAFILVGLPQTASFEPSLLRVFGTAAVAICAMILPGVSGSFLLKTMGLYEASLAALNNVDVLYIAVFMVGATTGLGLFSKALAYLLEHWHDVTMAALVGLMAGGLRALWPYLGPEGTLHLPGAGDPVLSVLIVGLIGFSAVFVLTLYSDRIGRPESESSESTA